MQPVESSEQPVINPQGTDEQMLDLLQKETFNYFLTEADEHTGLIADKTQPGSPASIAAVGMGISCFITGVVRKFLSREEAANRILKVLTFFKNSQQSTNPDASGYKGFYYHFLHMQTGERAWQSELSTVDTAILLMGIISARYFFTQSNNEETQIREIADALYNRVDWQWATNGKETVTHGWTPESGFLKYRWNNRYSEAHVIYVLALGSPTFPIKPSAYKKWIATFEWLKLYDIECIYAGPLFIHQMSQIWINFKNIMDDKNRKVGIDYFENSRRATLIQQKYAIDNPSGFKGYSHNGWGFTASDGPGPAKRKFEGKRISFYDYVARGIPYGPDDGTISPWAVAASIPFAPEIVLPTLRHAIEKLDLKKHYNYGFDASYNPTFEENSVRPKGWVSPWQFGLNQGPIIIMIENYRSGLIWNILKKSPHIINGLKSAGFKGGWLEEDNEG